MDDKNSKRVPDSEIDADALKKGRGTLFRAEIEQTVAVLKRDLAEQTREVFPVVLKESADIFQSLNANINAYTKTFYENPEDEQDCLFEMEQDDDEEDTEIKLGEYLARIQFFMEFSKILKRVKPFCNFVDANFLRPIQKTLGKIREACGCDLRDAETWGIALPYTDKLCELAMDFETRKTILLNKHDDLYDEMEMFISTYKNATAEDKQQFHTKIAEDNMMMNWMRPWLDIAEGKEHILEGALLEAMKVFPEQENLMVKRGLQ